MIRIGVVGLGFGERVHVPALRRTGRFEVAAVACRTAAKAKAAAERLGVERAYGRWSDLVKDPTLRAVSIATPPLEQVRIARRALASGKAVLLEKPVSLTARQADDLERDAAAAGAAVMVDFEFCEIDVWQEAKRLLDEGRIGRLRQVTVTWHLETYASRQRLDTWKLRTAEGGGALYQFAPHVLHYLEWFGGPLGSLQARSAGASDDLLDSCVRLTADYLSGAAASVSILTDAPGGSGHRIELTGSEGSLLLENTSVDPIRGFRLREAVRGQEERWSGAGWPGTDESDQDGRIQAVSRLAGRFADWVENGRRATPSLAEGARAQRLIDRILRSSRTGRRLECPAERTLS